jgi:thiamine kinase
MIGVDQALDAIPGFGGSSVSQQLSNGPTNSSYLLEKGGEKFVLRLDKPAARELGLDRKNEEQVLGVLAEAGLAPLPVYYNVSSGVLLRPWLEGRTWTAEHMKDRNNLSRLARLLRQLHTVRPVGNVFDPLGAARHYARQLGPGKPAGIMERAEQLASELASWPEAPVLCHNDPVCHNILDGASLVLIDWEYSAAGDRYFDLAVALQHHDVDDALSRCFLENYLDRKARADEWRHLKQQRNFYQCLLQLWNQVVA